MARVRLTKALLNSATHDGRTYRAKDGSRKDSRVILWDSEVRGLGCRIHPSGRKIFVLRYYSAGRERVMSIGEFGPLTVHQARQLARSELGKAAQGADPLAERNRAREPRRDGLTVADLAERYMREHAIPKKKPSSVQGDRWYLDRFILPKLGTRAVADVDRQHMARLHHELRATPYQANRVLALCSKLFSLAEAWGYRPTASNPTTHVERFPERKRERFLSSAELARLGDVLREAEAEGREPLEAITAVRLLLFTGARMSEILTVEWSMVDFERRCLRLRDSKTGAKVIPLGAAALELLAGLPRLQGNPYVLPGRDGRGHLVGLRKIWYRLRASAGLEDVRLHDLRHTFASFGAGGGLGLPIVGKLLGHRRAVTTAKYAHLADDPVQRGADQVAGEIAGALDGNRGGDVVAHGSRR